MPGGVGAQRSSWDVRRGRNCAEGMAENKSAFELGPFLPGQSSCHGVRYPKNSDNRTDAQPLVQFKSFGSVNKAIIESKPHQP